MKQLLAVTAVLEVATGMALIVVPTFVVKLLFGPDIAGIAIVISQFAGLALLSLGVACWSCGSAASALSGMLTYSSLATLGLLYLALGGNWNGPLLWPAVVLHAVLTLLFTWAWFKSPEDAQTQNSSH